MSKVENLKDTYRYLVGGYFGIREMDEYPLKEFVLKDIEEYIENFKTEYFIQDFDYEEEKRIVEVERPLVTKLQDSLLVLPNVNASMELVLLVKAKIKMLKDEKNKKNF